MQTSYMKQSTYTRQGRERRGPFNAGNEPQHGYCQLSPRPLWKHDLQGPLLSAVGRGGHPPPLSSALPPHRCGAHSLSSLPTVFEKRVRRWNGVGEEGGRKEGSRSAETNPRYSQIARCRQSPNSPLVDVQVSAYVCMHGLVYCGKYHRPVA